MEVEIIGVFIPIIAILVTGLLLVTHFYLKSRERQMLIEKGLSAEDIKKFFEQKEEKKDPYVMMKIGIISVAFGTGLGLGLMLEDITYKEYWVSFSLFVVTGLGFIVANLVTKKLNKDN